MLAVAAVLVAFAALTLVVESGALHGVEVHLARWLADHQTEPFHTTTATFAVIGSWYVMAPLSLAAAALLVWRHRGGQALYLVLTMATQALLDATLKLLFRRPRPMTGVVHLSTYSYPSGHSMAAAAFASALVFVAWPTRWRRAALAGGVAFAGLMGLSRVFLTAHWPSDVLAGWLIGFALAAWLRVLLDAALQPGADREQPRDGGRDPIDVVLLDWGDTLMVGDPSQIGPMATWPRVAAVPGAREMLRRLHPRYRLVVATNTDLSSGPDVRAALARVGLDDLVDAVVSSRDVGARKPDQEFFEAALRQAGVDGKPVRARRAVMVGDRLDTDIAGARATGLRAVWYDPLRRSLVAGEPVPDAIITRLAELPGALDRLAARGRGPGTTGVAAPPRHRARSGQTSG